MSSGANLAASNLGPDIMSNDAALERQEGASMNYARTAILLAGLTGLFMAVGYLIGGGSGALIALIIAAGTNLFSYWNSDRLVLSMHGAQEVDEHSAPEFVAIVRELAQRAGLPMPRVYFNGKSTTQCFRHRTQSATCRGLRDDGATKHAEPRRNRRRHRSRTRPCA